MSDATDIDQQYVVYAGRHATTAEINAWSQAFTNGSTPTTVRDAILNSSLGKPYIDAQITASYQTYAGRPPLPNELLGWETVLNGNNHDFSTVRVAILNDPIGQSHTLAALTSIYQTYAGRGPSPAELSAANSMLLAGSDFNAVRTSVLDTPAIHTYEVTQINVAYQIYAGRAPTSGEITAWDGALHGGATYSTIRDAILATPMGHYYVDQQITAAYQTYGGRAPTSAELTAWENVIGSSQNYGVVKTAILNSPVGNYYADQQITTIYQTFGGRAATSGELTAWENVLNANNHNYNAVRDAVLNSSLGKTYTDAQIDASYQLYGGRHATSGEITAWENLLNTNNHNFSVVRDAVLNSSLGQAYTDAQINTMYQTYGGRAAASGEISAWESVLNGNNHNFTVVRDAILNSSLGHGYTDAQITQSYQTFAGRLPTSGEISAWENALNGNNHDFSAVRTAILNDPVGINYSSGQVDGLYERYFLRDPTPDEQTTWRAVLTAGADYDAIRDTLMSSSGSAGTTAQLDGSVTSDPNGKPYTTITGFNPAEDVINLQGAGYSNINPLDSAHAREIHTLNGTTDVFIALDANHEILIHNVTLAQLSISDFML